MKGRRTVPPRPIGLLHTRDARAGKPPREHYPHAIGDRIAGDLTVIGHLARGRIGHLYQVWSARDWCTYTCKILSEERRLKRADVAALRREARILKRFRHPNIVRSFGEGEDGGLPYILMEYLEGATLFDVIEDQPKRQLMMEDALRTGIHLGSALYYMHRHGYLHLDLKPANLILRDQVPVLIDMDAARPYISAGRPSRRLGTAPYMAPEQVTRTALGPQADIYGLGAMLYELLTGRWPFEEVYEREDGDRETLERQFPQITGMLPPSPRQFRADLTESLERTVMMCLASDPEDRYSSMHPLLLALAGELQEPVSLWPPGVSAERRQLPRD
ncbi:MAG: serine/threonine-protein kinase [Longimicrobiales bacterium]